MHNTLDFKDYISWLYKFENFFKEHKDYKYILDDFKNDPDCKSLDEFSQEISEDIKNYINKRYTHIIYYHASATDNINSYLSKGILPSNVEDRIKFARKIFNQDDFPEITNNIFNKAKNEFLKDKGYISNNEGKIYFLIDDNILKENDASHYACYGGETLLCFANLLGRNYKYFLQEKLKPIILKTKIPIELLEDYFDDISRDLTIKFFECKVFPKYKLSYAQSTISISSVIKPEFIVACEFPKDLDCI